MDRALIITPSINPGNFVGLVARASWWPEDGELEHVLVNNAQDAVAAGRLRSIARQASWGVVELGYNASFSEACNAAVEAAGASTHVMLLNDDLEPREGMLQALWDARERASIVGSMLLHRDGTVNHAGARFLPDGYHVGRGERPENHAGCP
ncbi:MAG: hypothetical protein L0Y64_26405, partial [Myxococcaceae bacterium]|nr:hypothetical protein [Myxococcaceae bacterium]